MDNDFKPKKMKPVKTRKSKVRGKGMFPMITENDREKNPRQFGKTKNKYRTLDIDE